MASLAHTTGVRTVSAVFDEFASCSLFLIHLLVFVEVGSSRCFSGVLYSTACRAVNVPMVVYRVSAQVARFVVAINVHTDFCVAQICLAFHCACSRGEGISKRSAWRPQSACLVVISPEG